MYKRRETHESLCIAAVEPDVLDLPNTVIADCNAASEIVLFKPSPEGLDFIDEDMVYAESWIHPNPIETHRHKLIKCAEVLVPMKVKSEYIHKIYASSEESREVLTRVVVPIRYDIIIEVNSHLFFQ